MYSKHPSIEVHLINNSRQMLSDKILSFYKELEIHNPLPKGILVMNPYRDQYTMDLCMKFYKKYYHDNSPRTLLLGINPGRFGSGKTGISFTDPVKLENECGIQNNLTKKTELSADFIYRMIITYGGPVAFYNKYFISSISPLGFTKNGKNMNYYDDKHLEKSITSFAVESINKLLSIGMETQRCFCIGEGKNFKFLTQLNEKHRWFTKIIPLAHPRYIMQYQRKQLNKHIRMYLEKLNLYSQVGMCFSAIISEYSICGNLREGIQNLL